MRDKFSVVMVGILVLGACRPAWSPAQPVAESVKTGAVPDYQVRYEGNYGRLLPIDADSAGPRIYLSDFPIDLNYLISLDLEFTLATPDDSLYRLSAVENLDQIVNDLDEDARTGEFREIEGFNQGYNLAGCRVPSDIQTPENLYCGFQFEKDGATFVILIYATTERDLSNPDAEPTRITLPIG